MVDTIVCICLPWGNIAFRLVKSIVIRFVGYIRTFNRAFAITWAAHMQIHCRKIKCLHRKENQHIIVLGHRHGCRVFRTFEKAKLKVVALVLVGGTNPSWHHERTRYSLLSTTPSKVRLTVQLKYTPAFSHYCFSRSLAHKSTAYKIIFLKFSDKTNHGKCK